MTGQGTGPGTRDGVGPPADSLQVRGPRPLRGRIRVPGDKSISHRALLLSARADGVSTLRGLSTGDDVRRTASAIAASGAEVDWDTTRSAAHVVGGLGRLHEPDRVLDVGNSGTGIRLLAGWCAALPWLSVLAGDDSIARRPMQRVAGPLRLMGARVDGRQDGNLPPLVVRGGGLAGIDYTLPVASAQVKSAVLLAGLGAEGETVVREPLPTRAHTEELLVSAGADLSVEDGGCTLRLRPSALSPLDLDVPGDPSQAAFWVVAACIAPDSDLRVEHVYLGRARAAFLDVLARMGADIEVEATGAGTGSIRARTSELRATSVSGAEVPALVDEVPVLAVAAAVAKGTTTFADAAELRVKETDRIATVTTELAAMGVEVEPRPDGLVVHGGAPMRGATVRSHGDHRIAMAMAVAGLAAEGRTEIDGWGAVATSYPGFVDDLEAVAR